MPEGSWGEGGDHRVWTADQIKWMWQVEYRCEHTFTRCTLELPWRQDKRLQDLLEKAGRELLLLQCSDWPFAITRGQAIDYGIKRFVQHVARFETYIDLAEKIQSDSAYLNSLSEVEKLEVEDAEVHDIVFPKIDLEWWNL
jgi:1,4-alpha-glucan branching enzyme